MAEAAGGRMSGGPSRPCRVVLVGMMGSGKTTVGRLLAAATGWPYHDNDELLRRRFGLTARELLDREGELGLRAAESAALFVGLAAPEPAIVGSAAGTILDAPARQAMGERGFVVWLRARADTLAGRAAGGWHRPWLGDDA
ncbi:MAG: serine transporter, partial [Chloroflexota bacterium]|nr:serine transporter [Chloroflexota bacterium]